VRLVVDSYARLISEILDFPRDSYHASFVTRVLRHQARSQELLSQDPSGSETQLKFLDEYDLGYHERRVRFLIAAFNWWYEADADLKSPSREQLDQAKQVVYDRLFEMKAITGELQSNKEFVDEVAAAFDTDAINNYELRQAEDIDVVIERSGDHLRKIRQKVKERIVARMPEIERKLYEDLVQLTGSWPPEARRDLLVRYIGFPYWDILVFPVEGLSDVAERDHVEVMRMSPLDATLLGDKSLAGVSLHHFGAFFSRRDREHDYLWGRLDAAERLISLLLDDPLRPGLRGPNEGECKRAFQAILDDERGTLNDAGQVITSLQSRVQDLSD
jgi:hypothetical protein